MTCKYCDHKTEFVIDVTGENDKLDLCFYHGDKIAECILDEIYSELRRLKE